MDMETRCNSHEEADERSPLADLPTELLLQLLGLLPKEALCYGGAVRNVCRRWRRITSSPSLWRHHHAECNFWDTPSRDLFMRTILVAPELASVRLAVHGLADQDVRAILQGCSRVRLLSVLAPRVCPRGVPAVVRHYSAWAETLHLALGACDAGPEILQAVETSRSLRTLRLAGALRLGPTNLSSVAEGCQLLQDLDVENVESCWAAELVAEVAVARGANLRRLVLPGRHLVTFDSVLVQVAEACRGLESLGASFADALPLVQHLPRLRRLRLWFSYSHDSDSHACCALSPAARAVLAGLEHLHLQLGCGPGDAEALLLAACSGMRSLHLAGDWLPQQLPHLLPTGALGRLRHLRRLRLDSAGLHGAPAKLRGLGPMVEVSVNGVNVAGSIGPAGRRPQ